MLLLNCISKCLQTLYTAAPLQIVPVRNIMKHPDWKMIRDIKRRNCVKEMGADRLRLNTIRKNDILPKDLQEAAHNDVIAMPRDSNYIRVRHRCAITSRPRGVVFKWRLSRIVWRHLADYNKLSGVQRAMW